MIVWSFLPGPGLLEAAEPATEWSAGAARVDTTPTRPVRMAGYASRTAPSAGVAHPLAAKALALADTRGTRAVIVTCDVIAFRRPFRDRVVDRVKARYGLPGEGLVLFASHTHAGPALIEPAGTGARDDTEGLKNNIDYTRELEDKIVNVVGAAIAKLQPAQLSYGVGRAHFALNRASRRPGASSSARTPPARPTRACRSSGFRPPTARRWRSSSDMPATTPRSAPT